jgi:hypothetical protein
VVVMVTVGWSAESAVSNSRTSTTCSLGTSVAKRPWVGVGVCR